MIQVKRAYELSTATTERRFLVDRLWPRGIRKEVFGPESWLKDVAPSDVLRRWFAHDPSKWDDFRRRYFEELDNRPDAWRPILEAARCGRVTLLYGARDQEHNNAIALKEYLEAKLGVGRKTKKLPSRTRRR